MTDLTPSQLNGYARTFGKLYNDLLIGTKACTVENCNQRRGDGSCGCIDMVKDMVDAIWEARDGRPERLDRILKALDEEAAERDNSECGK